MMERFFNFGVKVILVLMAGALAAFVVMVGYELVKGVA